MHVQKTNWTEKLVTSSRADNAGTTHMQTPSSPSGMNTHARTHTMTTLAPLPRRCQLTHWEQGAVSGLFAAKCSHRFGFLQDSEKRKQNIYKKT